MSMLVEDTEKEIAQGRAEEAEAQKDYEEERDSAQAMKDSITDTKVWSGDKPYLLLITGPPC